MIYMRSYVGRLLTAGSIRRPRRCERPFRIGQPGGGAAGPHAGSARRSAHPGRLRAARARHSWRRSARKIQHIVFIVKENRSFDIYFGTFPGADGATTGDHLDRRADRRCATRPTECRATSATTGKTRAWRCTTARWTASTWSRRQRQRNDLLSMTQYRRSDIPNYWSYAEHFALADHMFSSLAGPSFPNHLYTVAAQSGGAINNPNSLTWGCDADRTHHRASDRVPAGSSRRQYPCFEFHDGRGPAGGGGRVVALLRAAAVARTGTSGRRSTPSGTSGRDRCGQQRGSSDSTVSRRTPRRARCPAVSWLIPDFGVSEHPTVHAFAGTTHQRLRVRRRELDGAADQRDHAGAGVADNGNRPDVGRLRRLLRSRAAARASISSASVRAFR